jgi:integrase
VCPCPRASAPVYWTGIGPGPIFAHTKKIPLPRQVRDSNLETRTARSRLKTRHKPYFRLIEPGLHLGYRKLTSGPGTWIVRRYTGDGAYVVSNLRSADGELVIADDYAEQDGERVLSFAQAQQRARSGRHARAGAYTVADAMDDYFRFLEGDGRSKHSIYDARRRDEVLIRPDLGKVKVAALTTDRLRHWRDKLVTTAPRLRTRKGETQRYGHLSDADDARRARRASANRTWTVLRAALNHAFNDGKCDSDIAWRKVKPFRKVDCARVRYLSVAEARRLINACDLKFRPLVQAALQTGARYGELCRLTVADFNADVGTLAIQESKSGQARHIVLTDEGRAFFQQITAARLGDEPLFQRQWGMSHQLRPMKDAVKRAKIKPAVSFHGLRHTWASLSVMAGMPLMVVARNLGHADTRTVEKHYGHLAPSYVANAVRRSAPRFGKIASNVTALR